MYYSVTKGGLGMNKSLAASIMAIYGSLVYLSSVLGGYVGDRLLSTQKTVFFGGVLIMFGHISLSLPFGKIALFISIILITIGSGFLKPNISNMVGNLYSPDDVRRDSGFTIYVFGINLGAFIAPILVPWAQGKFNFHVGFSLAAIGMFLGLVFYLQGSNKYLSRKSFKVTNPLKNNEKASLIKKIIAGVIIFVIIIGLLKIFGKLNIDNFINLLSIIGVLTPVVYFAVFLTSKKVSKIERSRIYAYIPLFLAAVVFWGIEEQGSVVLALFAQEQTQNHILGFVINPANYQTLNPFFIMLYTPVFAFLWTHLGKKQPSSPNKFALGMIITGFSYFLMVIPIMLFGPHKLVSPLWLVGSWAIVEIAEMLISPIGLSVTTELAPKAFQSSMMSMWFLADAAGQAITSQIVKFYTRSTEIPFFAIIATISVICGIILFLMSKKIKVLMRGVL